MERGRSREKGESELSRFISLILGRRHLVSDTCLGKEEFWLLEGRVRSDEGARRVGQGKIRELAPEPVQCPSVLSTEHTGCHTVGHCVVSPNSAWWWPFVICCD